MVRSGSMLMMLLLFFSCTTGTESGKPLVMGTIHPYTMLLKQISGDRFRVVSFIPPGASPHTYAASPGDIKKLGKSRLILANGLGLEQGLERRLRKAGNRVIFAGSPVSGRDKHRNPDGHRHDGVNPHLWMDVKRLIRLAGAVADRLGRIDPEGKPVFRKNAALVIQELKAADRQIKKERKKLRSARMITFHDSFYYFRKRYNIELVAVVAASPGRQPSSKELVRIGEKIHKRPARVIFIEPQLNPKAARVLAREYGLKVAVIDPLGATTGVQTVADHLLKTWSVMRPYFGK